MNTLATRCREIVHAILTRNRWELFVDETSFVNHVIQRVQMSENPLSLDEKIVDSVFYYYGLSWHSACSSTNTPLQQRAYKVMDHYLTRLIRRTLYAWNHGDFVQDNHFCEDAKQNTIVVVVRKIASVKDPSCFISWVKSVCVNTLKAMFREIGEPYYKEEEITRHEEIPQEYDMDTLVVAQEFAVGFKRAIALCLPSAEQRAVIEASVLRGLKVAEIAIEMILKPLQVSQRKTHGMKVLKRCLPLLEFLESWVNS